MEQSFDLCRGFVSGFDSWVEMPGPAADDHAPKLPAKMAGVVLIKILHGDKWRLSGDRRWGREETEKHRHRTRPDLMCN